MKKKLRKVGNSISLSLPSDMLKDMNVTEGDYVIVEYDINRKEIKIRNENSTPSIDYNSIDTIRDVVEDVLKKRGLL
jgi:antitoxin component of MazEF toxin-antitoxin module